MNADGSGVKRLTQRPGPDGGPFFSFDGKQIVFADASSDPGPERDDYLALLKDALWRPTQLEIFVMDRDGGNVRSTHASGWCELRTSWHPDGRRIIFSSNHHNPKGRNFDLFLINLDGTGLEQVTFNPTFDGFPMFSPDGRSSPSRRTGSRRQKERRTFSWRTGTTAPMLAALAPVPSLRMRRSHLSNPVASSAGARLRRDGTRRHGARGLHGRPRAGIAFRRAAR